jgi:hypothetical protein
MKRLYTAVAVFALSLAVGVTAMAQGKTSGKGPKKAACSSCNKTGATPEQIRKFKADSIDLRQEMMNKRFDLQRENLKDAPDAAKVAAIKADMAAIKVKIDAIKAAASLPQSASCCMEDCPLMDCCSDSCKNCNGGACKDGKKGKHCDKSANSAKGCDNCNKKSDCGCMNCSKGAACDKCDKAADCSCSKKSKK